MNAARKKTQLAEIHLQVVGWLIQMATSGLDCTYLTGTSSYSLTLPERRADNLNLNVFRFLSLRLGKVTRIGPGRAIREQLY
jgi:hypothetical protein